MRNNLKDSFKILLRYILCLLLFAVFATPFMKYKVACTFVLFIMMAVLIYSEMYNVAKHDKQPKRNIKPNVLRGLMLGFIGFLPVFIIFLIIYIYNPAHSTAIIYKVDVDLNKLKLAAEIALLCPLYLFFKAGGETAFSFFISMLIVPFISMLGYISGYYDLNLLQKILRPKAKK